MTVTALVTMAELTAHLNMLITPTDAIVAELQGFIDDCTPVVEDIVGHVVPATFDERYDGGNVSIQLRQLPVLTVASVTEVIGFTNYTLTEQPPNATTSAFGFSVDNLDMGIMVRRDGGGGLTRFYANRGNIEVVYTAGRATVPGNVRRGTLELIRHWWQYGQQAQGRVGSYAPGSAAEDDSALSTTPSGYLVPNRVKELLQPSQRPVVIA